MNSQSSILAPELIDIILDFLYDDYATLKNCILTCTSWIPTCRLHLFDTVHLTEKTLKLFWTLLQTSPHLGPYVKFLHVELCSSDAPELFSSLTTHLTSLEDLDIYASERPLVPWDSFPLLARTVVRLHVEAREAFEGPWDLVKLVSAFPKIKRFSVYDRGEPAMTVESVMALAEALSECKELNILDLQFSHLANVFTGILRLYPFDALDTLLFQPCCIEEWDAFPSLLSTKAKSWKNVTLILGDLHEIDEVCIGEITPALEKLSTCTSLRRLRFIAARHTLTPLKALLSSPTLSRLSEQLSEFHLELEFINDPDKEYVEEILEYVRQIVALLKEDRWNVLRAAKITVITGLEPVKTMVMSICSELQASRSKLKMRYLMNREP